MKPFELVPHTADAKLRAYGRTLDEAFAHVVEALAAIATDREVSRARSLDVHVEARDVQGLLAGTADVTIGRNTSGYALSATLHGDTARAYGCNLKAATYSDMIAEERDGVWTLQAVVDI